MLNFFQNFLTVGQDGLQIIATAVLPILFPFFVLTSLILNLTTTTHPWMISLLAYCSGYPNGTRLTQNLYIQKRITLPQAQKLVIATSTPSPIFVIASTGMVFLKDIKLGCVIFLCAVVSAILNSWLWCPRQISRPQIKLKKLISQPTSFFTTLSEALTNATNAIINVCGVVLFFYIATHSLCLPTVLAGLLEMTTGVAATTNPYLIQLFVTFGGLSVAMQQQIFMRNFNVKFYQYLCYKLTHAILACGLLALFLLFLN